MATEGGKPETQTSVTASCRKKKSESATFLEDVRDHIDEFIHASMDEHQTCFKKTIQKMFGLSKVVAERNAEVKEVESKLPLRTVLSEQWLRRRVDGCSSTHYSLQYSGAGASNKYLSSRGSLFNSISHSWAPSVFSSHWKHAASKALACLNHRTLRGKPIRIMWWQRESELRKSGIGNVFVKNLAPSVTNAQLESVFSKYGIILSCKVVEEKNGKSKCFGYVQFETHNSAISAFNSLHGAVFEGKKLHVSPFKKKEERMMDAFNKEQKFTNLYVKNFGYNMTEDFLREKFSRYGKINSAVIMRDEEGNSRGFGFVNFDSDEDARKAIEALNGELIGSKELFVGRAQKKAERERLLGMCCVHNI